MSKMSAITSVFLILVILTAMSKIEMATMRNIGLYQSIEINNKQSNANNVRQARIFFDQLAQVPGLMPPMFMPIEINVPDSIMGMMNGLMVMWDAMQEYFSSESSVDPRIAAVLEFI